MVTFHDLSSVFALIRVTGSSRADFLHRMSTGDLISIKPGEVRATVFTTPIGRMVEVGVVYAFADHLLLRVSTRGKDKLLRWLRKYVFYNDDVQFTDERTSVVTVGMLGDGVSEWIRQHSAADHDDQHVGHWQICDTITAHQTMLSGAPVVLLMGDQMALAPFIDGPMMLVDAYESARISAGIPKYGHEISEDFNPLEAGLWDCVSFTKGCYIGQEIFARMESRNQLAKKLVVIELADGQQGARVVVAGADVGSITSASANHALAYVRSAAAIPNEAVTSGTRIGRIDHVARASGL